MENKIDMEKLPKENTERRAEYANRNEMARQLSELEGHPLNTFMKENKLLSELIAAARAAAEAEAVTTEQLEAIRSLTGIHYAKKGDLLYPQLKVKYEVTGPSDVLWTADDAIRDGLKLLRKFSEYDERWYKRFKELLGEIELMIKKEENILFPVCAANFTEEEWMGVYHDAKDYETVQGVQPQVWEAAELWEKKTTEALRQGEVVMPGGHMTIEQLTAMLNALPMEITFVDADNINRFFNEGPKVFKRPAMAIDREVFSCHPPKIEPMVRSIIEDFREGVRDSVPVWMEKGGRAMLVTYMAVRDKDGKYIGTMELVQDMEAARRHFTKA